jgi:hypothetical protein
LEFITWALNEENKVKNYSAKLAKRIYSSADNSNLYFKSFKKETKSKNRNEPCLDIRRLNVFRGKKHFSFIDYF